MKVWNINVWPGYIYIYGKYEDGRRKKYKHKLLIFNSYISYKKHFIANSSRRKLEMVFLSYTQTLFIKQMRFFFICILNEYW